MSPEDQRRIERLQERIKEAEKDIPPFVHDGMSESEIQRALIKEIERTGETVAQVSPLDVNGRYSKPKDEYFTSLVRELNMTRVKGNLEAGLRDTERFFISRADTIANHYSTKDLRRFITEELGQQIWRGGRQEYITTIGLDLMHHFNPRGITGITIRHNLYESTSFLKRRVGSIRQSLDIRSTYRSRIAEIQAKYKGGKK